MTAARVSASSSRASKSSASLSFNRHCTAIAPCPTAGMHTSGERTSEIRLLNPRRSNPAFETTTASYSPLSTLRRRVSTLPRKSRKSRSGRTWRNWAWRRKLLVPTRAPCRRFASVEPTRQSRTSSRLQTAGNIRREGTSVGMSFTLCTARSIVSSSRASSSSLMKMPLLPICATGAFSILSPAVLITTISGSIPVAAKSRLRTNSACHFASRLPRVPMRKVLKASPDSKGTGRARPRHFAPSGASLFRLASAAPARAADSRAYRPSVFPRGRGPPP